MIMRKEEFENITNLIKILRTSTEDERELPIKLRLRGAAHFYPRRGSKTSRKTPEGTAPTAPQKFRQGRGCCHMYGKAPHVCVMLVIVVETKFSGVVTTVVSVT